MCYITFFAVARIFQKMYQKAILDKKHFEHHIQEQFLKNPPKELYEISYDIMTNENQNIINNITE